MPHGSRIVSGMMRVPKMNEAEGMPLSDELEAAAAPEETPVYHLDAALEELTQLADSVPEASGLIAQVEALRAKAEAAGGGMAPAAGAAASAPGLSKFPGAA